MSSEHVEVLERLRGVLEHGKMGDKCLIAPDLVTAAIASLSAPQPPAEAQPVAWLGANPRTGVPVMAVRTPAPSVMRDFAMRPLYANPPPSAPAGGEESSTGCGSFGPVFEHLANAYGVSSEAGDGAAMHCHAKAIEALREAVGFVQTEVRDALRELDSVTAADDQADAIGCAENALNRALAALAQQPAAEAQPCGCGEATCTVPWEPGCGLGKSEQHAEAQEQGGGEAELRRMVARLAAHVRPTCGELWAEAERLLNRTAPPSAPVGVEAVLRDALQGLIDFIEIDNLPMDADAMFIAKRALAQQPAAVDGADAQDAEIEALRVRDDAMAGEAIKHEARAERLAEALRMMVENADDLVAYRHDEDDIGDRPCCQVASYEPHADHCPTHIARAALRDHDQGGGNP